MLKKTIKYTDYNDEVRVEDYYFNLSRAELVMLESSKLGGMKAYYERISQAKDNVAIMEAFRELIHMSVGEKSPDGKRFIKSEEIATAFEQSEAYSELIMELLSDAKIALAFVRGVMPASIVAEMGKNQDEMMKLLDNIQNA